MTHCWLCIQHQVYDTHAYSRMNWTSLIQQAWTFWISLILFSLSWSIYQAWTLEAHERSHTY